jgi:pimeloyl-ACP methyl ester carboxylesterase
MKPAAHGDPEAGIGSFSSNWAWVQTELAASTRVVAYDRAGLGWSDPAPAPQDAQESARDLHLALQKAGIPGPYVVAGHSYGGLVARAFAGLYPQEVAGMVMVDASHPDQWTTYSSPGGAQWRWVTGSPGSWCGWVLSVYSA